MHQMLHAHADDQPHMVIIQRVDDGFSLPAEAHQLGVLEGAQLMADGALGQTQKLGQVADAQLAFEQGIQDADAGGVTQHPEQVGQILQPVVAGHQAVEFLQVGMFVLPGTQVRHGKGPPFDKHMSICSYV